MHNERIAGWPPLYLKNTVHRCYITRMRPQSIHRFGRECHQLALAQRLRRSIDAVGIGMLWIDSQDVGVNTLRHDRTPSYHMARLSQW